MATQQIINNPAARAQMYVMPTRKIMAKTVCSCNRCGHFWRNRIENPARCPGCKSPYWGKWAGVLVWNPEGKALCLSGPEYDPSSFGYRDPANFPVWIRAKARLGDPLGIALLKAWEDECFRLGRNPNSYPEFIAVEEKAKQQLEAGRTDPPAA